MEAQLGIQWCLHPGEKCGHLLDIDAFPSKENVVSKGHSSSGSHQSPEHDMMVRWSMDEEAEPVSRQGQVL